MAMNEMENMNHHGMMPMYFNAELGFNVLFKSWSLDTAGDVVGASFGFFFLAVFYEALKWFRDRLMRQAIARSVERNRQKQGKSLRCSATEETTITLPVLDHILQIVLHMIQIFVSYLLMLVFMTYNVWLAVSILFGSGVGYGLFNVRIRVRGCEQVAPSKKSEHCQH
ncbi:high affinity copper uptake protein 1-like [Oscarella lobularis]|uniref:high affinity copper uptake protein 1-like n=1 Tax=Oscarella lobularis TaxID=121494 RepID=UPI00331389DD